LAWQLDKDLYNMRDFDGVPLELMPREIGYSGIGEGVVRNTNRNRGAWDDLAKTRSSRAGTHLDCLFQILTLVRAWISRDRDEDRVGRVEDQAQGKGLGGASEEAPQASVVDSTTVIISMMKSTSPILT